MKAPSSPASIRYSGQWVCRAAGGDSVVCSGGAEAVAVAWNSICGLFTINLNWTLCMGSADGIPCPCKSDNYERKCRV